GLPRSTVELPDLLGREGLELRIDRLASARSGFPGRLAPALASFGSVTATTLVRHRRVLAGHELVGRGGGKTWGRGRGDQTCIRTWTGVLPRRLRPFRKESSIT